MAPKIQVDSYDYRMAIEKVEKLMFEKTITGHVSATEIVDLVIDTVLN